MLVGYAIISGLSIFSDFVFQAASQRTNYLDDHWNLREKCQDSQIGSISRFRSISISKLRDTQTLVNLILDLTIVAPKTMSSSHKGLNLLIFGMSTRFISFID